MGNAHAVMSAMNRAGAVWVGASDALLNEIARGEWGFDGYCITDMAASNTAYIMTYQDGIPGGTDLFLGSGSRTALDAYKEDATFAQAMREASHRILYVVANYSAALNGMTPDTSVGETSWWWSNAIMAGVCTAGALAAVCIAMYGISAYRERRHVTS